MVNQLLVAIFLIGAVVNNPLVSASIRFQLHFARVIGSCPLSAEPNIQNVNEGIVFVFADKVAQLNFAESRPYGPICSQVGVSFQGHRECITQTLN